MPVECGKMKLHILGYCWCNKYHKSVHYYLSREEIEKLDYA